MTETPATPAHPWPHVFEPGDPGTPVLLLLHGTGGSEHDLLPLAPRLSPGAGILSPRGPVSENGMNRWFRRLREGVFDTADVVARAGELAGFLGWAREAYGLGDRPVAAVGFSNGANIALATALLHPGELDRVVAFSGMYPLDAHPVDTDLAGTRVALFNGAEDPMAPQDSVERLTAVLQSHGADVERATHPGGHGITADDVTAAALWIGRAGVVR
ncbi:alpha/beta hydrolase [Arthrobacter crusticola]|uniref:Alpha/beta hydrolase n=1 Tax=Arthrobacter crusticola TaxID=2547960 RepID=A0A4R5TUC3_9MICC|nr:alpha/beta hydrolase [Arthrobacter crusticola]TDK24647.1 alpha/beta hydrolase [Arthrobacter crusticola]